MIVGHRPAPRAQAFRSLGGIPRHRRVETVQLKVGSHELDSLVVDEILLVLGEGEDGLQETCVREHPRLHVLERVLRKGASITVLGKREQLATARRRAFAKSKTARREAGRNIYLCHTMKRSTHTAGSSVSCASVSDEKAFAIDALPMFFSYTYYRYTQTLVNQS